MSGRPVLGPLLYEEIYGRRAVEAAVADLNTVSRHRMRVVSEDGGCRVVLDGRGDGTEEPCLREALNQILKRAMEAALTPSE